MTYSIVSIQGKQFKVSVGDKVTVDRLSDEEGKTIPLDKVLMTVDGDKTEIGTPYVSNSPLFAKVISHGRGEKIRVAKYRSKSRYRKVRGHRQDQTTLEILSGAAKKTTAKKTETKATKKSA